MLNILSPSPVLELDTKNLCYGNIFFKWMFFVGFLPILPIRLVNQEVNKTFFKLLHQEKGDFLLLLLIIFVTFMQNCFHVHFFPAVYVTESDIFNINKHKIS